ncbi:unnamed protein product [Adineta steineri]|uniref:Xylulose kinase n=1 Tax=Adineta steineri TaxID=433720 RepID=A0A818VCW6_9BILA|nr:unnamed protein product [Adineta steineri]CAF3710871.1 unnamed protein product [Adineta steineri]
MTDKKNHQRLYLGLDLSTHQLKGVIIDEHLNTIAEEAIHFNDKSLLVNYVQSHGFAVDNHCITTPVLVFLEALDVLFQKLRDQKKFDFADIIGISGCAQQHGSIYWKNKIGLDRLKNLHSSIEDKAEISNIHNLPKNVFLVDLLHSSFSCMDCSIRMDGVQFIEKNLDSNEKLLQITDSKAYDRFTACQIMKMSRTTPEIYEQTERIQLLSNFLASILLGDYAPIDLSDGSRMNLFDIRQRKWSKDCLNICAKDLEEKLSNNLIYPSTILGTIAKYFVERYGFNNTCQIVSFTGDNPSSYYALALNSKTIVISLGTSDTVMASVSASSIPNEIFDGHLFVNPLIVNSESDLLMILLCFKNGSLVRERVREEVASNDWQQMSELLCQTPPTNHGYLGFFYDDNEIIPENLRGRFYFNPDGQQIDDLEPACKVRALLESQCLAKRLYLQRANIDLVNNVDRIVINGGASVNIDFLQMLADIFSKPVYATLAPNSGCLGGALRAIDVINHISNSQTSTLQFLVSAQPRNEYTPVYNEMLIRYARLEDKILKNMQ